MKWIKKISLFNKCISQYYIQENVGKMIHNTSYKVKRWNLYFTLQKLLALLILFISLRWDIFIKEDLTCYQWMKINKNYLKCLMDETVSPFIFYSKELPANWRKFYPAQIRNKSGILLHLKWIVHQTAVVPTITAYQLRQTKQWKFAQNLCFCKVIDRLTLIHCLILKHKFVFVGNIGLYMYFVVGV